MEQRKRIGGNVVLLIILLIIGVGWYGHIDDVRIIKNENRKEYSEAESLLYLTTDELRTYSIYSKQPIVYKVTRSYIPFIYNKEVIDKGEFKIMKAEK